MRKRRMMIRWKEVRKLNMTKEKEKKKEGRIKEGEIGDNLMRRIKKRY